MSLREGEGHLNLYGFFFLLEKLKLKKNKQYIYF